MDAIFAELGVETKSAPVEEKKEEKKEAPAAVDEKKRAANQKKKNKKKAKAGAEEKKEEPEQELVSDGDEVYDRRLFQRWSCLENCGGVPDID